MNVPLVSGAATLRSTMLKLLREFRNQGGKLIFAGDPPRFLDAVLSEEPAALWKESICVPDSDEEILKVLEPERMADAYLPSGARDTGIIYQLRKDGEDCWLFLANGRKPADNDFDACPLIRFQVSGCWNLTEYDTLSGNVRPVGAEHAGKTTCFERVWHSLDSLLRLKPCNNKTSVIGTSVHLEEKRLNLDYERIYHGEQEDGSRIMGTGKVLTAPVRRLGFGDIVPQGLPFYTGNLLYRIKINVPKGSSEVTVRVPTYHGALLEVLLDKKPQGEIIFSPYELRLHDVTPGQHLLEIRFYNTRYNGFGQLHHTQGTWYYQSPNSYRSMDDAWTYEYRFREAGILFGPIIAGAETVTILE